MTEASASNESKEGRSTSANGGCALSRFSRFFNRRKGKFFLSAEKEREKGKKKLDRVHGCNFLANFYALRAEFFSKPLTESLRCAIMRSEIKKYRIFFLRRLFFLSSDTWHIVPIFRFFFGECVNSLYISRSIAAEEESVRRQRNCIFL